MAEIVLHHGDNRGHLQRLIDEGVRVHSAVMDPPYGMTSITKRFGKKGAAPAKFGRDGAFSRASTGFLGSKWDATGIERDPEFWRLVYDILLPGGYVVAFSAARTGHWQACAMEMAGFIMHPTIGWAYGCLDDQSECLTRRGWLRHTEIAADDEVMQWDSASGALSWTQPVAVHEYPFNGNMVMIENRHTRQMLTPNHRVYAKVRRHSRHRKATEYEVLDAASIQGRSGAWQVDLPMAGDLDEGAIVDVDYAYLVGWWLTDAWPHRDANACMFSQSKPKTLAKLRSALEPHGAAEYVKSSKNDNHAVEHSFYLTGEIADRLRSEFPDRALGWEVLSWSKAARCALYEGLMDGDGSRPGQQNSEAFWSQNQHRRDVFVALALSLGYRAYDDPRKGAVYVNPKTSTTQIQGKHRGRVTPYQGKVWCLTVPTGAFVARRNGRPFITGNSGFPKDHDAAMAIDKQLGAKGTRGGVKPGFEGHFGKDNLRSLRESGTMAQENGFSRPSMADPEKLAAYQQRYVPATPEAAEWDGWSYGAQALKPALEPIYVGQKPFDEKNGALNLLKHGVGAINIDGCRVGDEPMGRHPANLLHDGSAEVVALFPESKGQQGDVKGTEPSLPTKDIYGQFASRVPAPKRADSEGSAARFFNSFPTCPESCSDGTHQEQSDSPDMPPILYHPKATKADRAGSKHPTVKPVALMRWLVRLVTPPGGVVLDPFAGSGTTGEAARQEGFDCILMEAEDQFASDIRKRFGLRTNDDFDDLLDGDDFAELLA